MELSILDMNLKQQLEVINFHTDDLSDMQEMLYETRDPRVFAGALTSYGGDEPAIQAEAHILSWDEERFLVSDGKDVFMVDRESHDPYWREIGMRIAATRCFRMMGGMLMRPNDDAQPWSTRVVGAGEVACYAETRSARAMGAGFIATVTASNSWPDLRDDATLALMVSEMRRMDHPNAWPQRSTGVWSVSGQDAETLEGLILKVMEYHS